MRLADNQPIAAITKQTPYHWG